MTNFGIVPFANCSTASSVGTADIPADTSTKLPGHWSRQSFTMRKNGHTLAVSALDPLSVTYGSSGSLPPSQLTGLFDHAVLPTGVCQLGNAAPSGPVQLSAQSNGVLIGSVGSEASNTYYNVTVDPPVALVLGNGKANEVAGAVWCGQGATSAWSGIYVFSYTGTGWRIDYGPLPTRSYEAVDGENDFGSGAEALSGGGKTFVADEEYGVAGDCGGCASGKATTTWGWSAADPSQLVIVDPKPTEMKVTSAVTPSALGGGAAVGNQKGAAIPAGASVPAVCTGEFNGDGSLWVELDTGAWIPATAISGALPADCDGQPFQQASACPSSDDAAFEAAATQNPPPDSDITATVSNSACAGPWALAAGQLNFGPGGGPSEWWFAAFSNSSGQWSAVAGADDGTCLLQPTETSCPDGTGGPIFGAPLLTAASLVAVSGLEFNPASGTVVPPGTAPGFS